MISYGPLWHTMAAQGISTYTLINKYGISSKTIYNLKHNHSITLYTLEKLCQILKCQAESVVVFEPDP